MVRQRNAVSPTTIIALVILVAGVGAVGYLGYTNSLQSASTSSTSMATSDVGQCSGGLSCPQQGVETLTTTTTYTANTTAATTITECSAVAATTVAQAASQGNESSTQATSTLTVTVTTTLTNYSTTVTTTGCEVDTMMTATTVMSVTGPTSPCNAPGVTCGSFTIESASLVAGTHGNDSALSVTIANTGTGNGSITGLVYFIDGQQVGQSQGVPLNDTLTYTIAVPAAFVITAGQFYPVTVEAFVDNGNLNQVVNITAS
jgi:hypothetical protein